MTAGPVVKLRTNKLIQEGSADTVQYKAEACCTLTVRNRFGQGWTIFYMQYKVNRQCSAASYSVFTDL